jgi:hypothetical protein
MNETGTPDAGNLNVYLIAGLVMFLVIVAVIYNQILKQRQS